MQQTNTNITQLHEFAFIKRVHLSTLLHVSGDKKNRKRVARVPEATHDLNNDTSGDKKTLLIHEQTQ